MSKTVQCFMLGARRLDKGVKQANHNKDNRYALKKQLSREEWGTGEEMEGRREGGDRKRKEKECYSETFPTGSCSPAVEPL